MCASDGHVTIPWGHRKEIVTGSAETLWCHESRDTLYSHTIQAADSYYIGLKQTFFNGHKVCSSLHVVYRLRHVISDAPFVTLSDLKCWTLSSPKPSLWTQSAGFRDRWFDSASKLFIAFLSWPSAFNQTHKKHATVPNSTEGEKAAKELSLCARDRSGEEIHSRCVQITPYLIAIVVIDVFCRALA